MKKTYFFALLLILLATSIGKVYSETVTISAASDKWTATGTSGTGSATSVTKEGITVSSTKGYKDGTAHIREYFNYDSGSIITISADNTKYITSVAFTSTVSGTNDNGPSKVSANENCTYNYSGSTGTAVATSTTTTSLSLKCTAQFRWKSVTITYTSTCTTPTFTIEDKTISLAEASGVYDMSGLSINKGGSAGTITYSCDDEDNVIIEGSTFLTYSAGTYTIKATMAADETYCGATTSFKIKVTDPSAPKYTITWSAPNSTETTTVTQCDALDLPTTDPTSCSETYTHFVGWFTQPAGTEDNPTTLPATQVTASTIPTANTTYYAVFSEEESKTTTALEYDTWTYSGTTYNKNGYRLFNSGAYVETEEFDLSTLTAVKVTIGTYGGTGYKDISVEDTTGNVWGTAAATGTTLTEIDVTKTGDLTGTGKLRIKSKSGTTKEQGVRMSKIIYTASSGTPATGYISSCIITPEIKGTKNIYATSGKDIWVEAVTPFVVSAKNLDKNTDAAAVTVIATSLTPTTFTLKGKGVQDTGDATVTLKTNYTQSALDSVLTIVYKPTQDNTMDTGKIVLRVYRTDAATTYATDTVKVYGRSLPAQFVVAAKTAEGWVALPADLDSTVNFSVKSPYAISVNDAANPTKATQAPATTIYQTAARYAANTCANGIRLRSLINNTQYLQGSKSKSAPNNTKVWLAKRNSADAQSWVLNSTNLTDYFVRLDSAQEGRYLNYYSTENRIGNYKQTNTLRFLPVETFCTRYDAPIISSNTPASTQVTLSWNAVTGATEYEYSKDNTNWTAITNISTTNNVTTAVIAGLTNNQSYTLYLRVKAAEPNCSAVTTVTFTTPDCDDVPTALHAYPNTNSVTIQWTATASTATVRIYSDADATTEVISTTDATSPCVLSGLTQNTTYYYRVFADGTCGSATESFTTETNDISVVEWNQNEMIVNVNAEGDDVSVVIQGKVAHGDETKNVADDLFFSKYYEATGTVKLLAIYNGTKDTLSLSNVTIKIDTGKGWSSGISVAMNTYGAKKKGYIAPNEEIIIWTKGSSYYYKDSNTGTAVDIVECISSKMDDVSILQTSTKDLLFGGQSSIGLFREDNLIDIIGAVNSSGVPQKGTEKPTWGDDPGWSGKGYNIENQTEVIDLSTNRCLLVRSNSVKSGENAVAKNSNSKFDSFTEEEWLGRQVSNENTDGTNPKGAQSSCDGFAYVADFNYNNYYISYDSIGGLKEIQGNRNADGTYTIPVNRLDTFACTNIRMQVKNNGAVVATKEQRVPIMVLKSTDTQNDTLFITKHTEDECKTCDVVVRNNATLTHVTDGRKEFRNMYIYAGSNLNIPETETFTLQTVHMHALNDNVSYAIINNSDASTPSISVNQLVHVKRIDGKYWYPFSLPYNCRISAIRELCGLDLGTYGTDWGIKYYDGQARQQSATSADLGQVGLHWKMMSSDAVLQANTGYIIGLFYPGENLMRSIYFTPDGSSAYTESAESKETSIYSWADNLTADARHHGWNFVGSPYISLFGETTAGQGLYNGNVKMGYTDTETGEQIDKEHVYVSIPNGANSNTYTQALASATTLRPFTAYFVQAIDPTDGNNNTLTLTYNKSNRSLQAAPARTQATDRSVLAELRVTNDDHTLCDNTGILVGGRYTSDYEIGDDLLKMYAAEDKPQLYTNDATYGKMAYLAIPDAVAHNISLGLYVPQAGNYTFSLNEAVSDISGAEAVYLLYHGAVVANLLYSDYTISVTDKGTVEGYGLDIRRTPQVVTEDISAYGDGPQILYRDGILYLDNLTAGAEVYVYDVLGRLLLNTTATGSIIEIPAVQTGVYTILMRTAEGQCVLKTLLR